MADTTQQAQRISSIPDQDFERPQTPDELFRVASLACDILYAVSERLLAEDSGAWEIVHDLHIQVVASHSWVQNAKWIGLPGWEKRAIA